VQGLAWSAAAAAALSAAGVVLVLAWPVFKHLNQLARQPQMGLLADHVNGTASKALFLDLAERERSRARRYGSGAALLLVDVDRAARLSEVHGPAAAHAVLRELARQTSPTLRGADTLALFGPTQMAVFLAQADSTGALDVAERIRDRAEHLQTPLPGSGPAQALHATVSVGVAQLRPAHLHLQALIDDAQEAVLAARQVGGNCVRAAPVELSPLQAPNATRNDHRARPQ
jgi:diguanylate cyclase